MKMNASVCIRLASRVKTSNDNDAFVVTIDGLCCKTRSCRVGAAVVYTVIIAACITRPLAWLADMCICCWCQIWSMFGIYDIVILAAGHFCYKPQTVWTAAKMPST